MNYQAACLRSDSFASALTRIRMEAGVALAFQPGVSDGSVK